MGMRPSRNQLRDNANRKFRQLEPVALAQFAVAKGRSDSTRPTAFYSIDTALCIYDLRLAGGVIGSLAVRAWMHLKPFREVAG